MPDALEVITRVISEHHTIRGHLKLAGDAVNDIEALFAIQRAHFEWTQSSIKALAEKQNQLLRAVNFLEQGLKNHFAFEEKTFPSLFGELLAKAILREHREIDRQIKIAKNALSNIKLEGLPSRATIQQNANDLVQAVGEHAQHEEIILNMIKEALEENSISLKGESQP